MTESSATSGRSELANIGNCERARRTKSIPVSFPSVLDACDSTAQGGASVAELDVQSPGPVNSSPSGAN